MVLFKDGGHDVTERIAGQRHQCGHRHDLWRQHHPHRPPDGDARHDADGHRGNETDAETNLPRGSFR